VAGYSLSFIFQTAKQKKPNKDKKLIAYCDNLAKKIDPVYSKWINSYVELFTNRVAGEHAGEIHLLMTDVVMPEMNGRDLARNLLSLYPQQKCLFMSGYTANVIAHHGVLDEGVFFIQKPFSMKDLAAAIQQTLAQE
jgi:FixJ family two-component response regulator